MESRVELVLEVLARDIDERTEAEVLIAETVAG